jgi:hypothetical protein
MTTPLIETVVKRVAYTEHPDNFDYVYTATIIGMWVIVGGLIVYSVVTLW